MHVVYDPPVYGLQPPSLRSTTLQSTVYSPTVYGPSMNFDKTIDPYRPLYHFSPPLGLWGGGPDGTIYHNGEYHVFYQYDPYMGCTSGNASWGHTVSRDLVHWEHRPVAIGPTPFSAEQYLAFARSNLVKELDRSRMPPIVYDREVCFSGSTAIHNGVPTIIYTGFFSAFRMCRSCGRGPNALPPAMTVCSRGKSTRPIRSSNIRRRSWSISRRKITLSPGRSPRYLPSPVGEPRWQ